MFIINYAICLTVFGLSISKVYGQCTFTDPFLSSTWLDNTKGTLVFTTNGMSGWAFNALRTTGDTSKRDTWQCVDYVPDKYLVLRTTASFTVDILGTNTPSSHAYLCMKLTKITNTSYIYYQQNAQRSRLGYERLHVTSNASLTNYTQVCDDSITVPTTEYHVIIKSGQAANSVITCPDSLLFSADYYVTSSDGTSNCTNTNDVWDVCSNITQMTFNYSTCSTQVMFSAGGVLSCVANVSSGGYDYVTVYNQDATLTGTATRFACISTSGRYSSVAPGNCTATQTPWAVPVKADQVTKVGQLLVITNYYQTCSNATTTPPGLSGGAIAGIVIGTLFGIGLMTSALIACIFCIFAFKVGMAVFADAVAEWPDSKRPASPSLTFKASYLTITAPPEKGHEYDTVKSLKPLSMKDPRYIFPKRNIRDIFPLYELEKLRCMNKYGRGRRKYLRPKSKILAQFDLEKGEVLPDVIQKAASPSNVVMKNREAVEKKTPTIHKKITIDENEKTEAKDATAKNV